MEASPSFAGLVRGSTARGATLASLVALVGLGLAWELWLAPTGHRTLAVKVLPLALAMPGVLRDRVRTYRGLTLLVWLYVTEGVVRAIGDRGTGALLALLELALCLALFGACLWRVRSESAR
ncbi:MAG TPA: DUF2069 domain-containing protein [Caldimonas sp.]|nr:DUF2069 domain-containing protein [Caldimonas sp.]